MANERKRCLIVEDEPLAAGLLRSYIETVSELELIGICHNAIEAMSFLRRENVDIIFIDIQMPQLSGLEFVRGLKNSPAIIFTTAHREYAAEGFDLDAVDYLVKPFSLERFLRAADKVLRRDNTQDQKTHDEPYVYYRVDRQQVKVFLRDILWIESLKDYLKIVLEGNRSLITYQRISYAEENLPSSLFLRIHRSFIIAKNKVTAYKADEVRIGENVLPVGNSYKQKVLDELVGKS